MNMEKTGRLTLPTDVDMVEEMTSMITSQRALQSAAQMLKMYDQVMSKSATDIGRM